MKKDGVLGLGPRAWVHEASYSAGGHGVGAYSVGAYIVAPYSMGANNGGAYSGQATDFGFGGPDACGGKLQ